MTSDATRAARRPRRAGRERARARPIPRARRPAVEPGARDAGRRPAASRPGFPLEVRRSFHWCKDSLKPPPTQSRTRVRPIEARGNPRGMAQDPIALLIEHGEEHGCVHMTELYEIAQKLELEEDDIESLLERLEHAGIE